MTTTGAVPNGVVGQAYAGVQFQQTGGSLPITWSITAGALPAGLTLNSSTGQITGTPTDDGPVSVTVTATDANGCSGSLTINFTVTCPVITLSPGSPLTDGLFNLAYGGDDHGDRRRDAAHVRGDRRRAASGHDARGGRPLSGTPTNTGPFSFTVTATDNSSAACAGSQAYALTVRPNAQGDTFNGAVGNTELIVNPAPPAEPTPRVEVSGTVLSNDGGPGTLTAGAGVVSTNAGGAVTLASDGTFLYRPAAGFAGRRHVHLHADRRERHHEYRDRHDRRQRHGLVRQQRGGRQRRRPLAQSVQHLNERAHVVERRIITCSSTAADASTPGDITWRRTRRCTGTASTYTHGAADAFRRRRHPVLSDSVTLATNTTVNSLTLNSGADPRSIGTNAMTGTVNINSVNVTGGANGLQLTNVPATVNVVGGTFSGVSGPDVHINRGRGQCQHRRDHHEHGGPVDAHHRTDGGTVDVQRRDVRHRPGHPARDNNDASRCTSTAA